MPSFDIKSSVAIKSDAKVKQIEGIFDIQPSDVSESTWKVDMPIEDKDWSIGLIVGPSGSGKTTVARKAFGDKIISGYEWDPEKAVVSQFPGGIREVAEHLSSVGFSSPRSWLRPFWALSNGEQFRVTLARAISEESDLFVMDEFTSVVDRTVAQIGSCAVAKAVRRSEKKMVAVACHYDIVEWLQPDWIFEPATNSFQWRSLRRRPDISLEVQRVDKAAWKLFEKHHYLNATINSACQCWVGSIDSQPVVFLAMLHFPHPSRSSWSGSRLVVMPDFQGISLGMKFFEYVSELYRATGKGVIGTSASPAMLSYVFRSKNWKITRKPGLRKDKSIGMAGAYGITDRNTGAFQFTGPANKNDAKLFGVI